MCVYLLLVWYAGTHSFITLRICSAVLLCMLWRAGRQADNIHTLPSTAITTFANKWLKLFCVVNLGELGLTSCKSRTRIVGVCLCNCHFSIQCKLTHVYQRTTQHKFSIMVNGSDFTSIFATLLRLQFYVYILWHNVQYRENNTCPTLRKQNSDKYGTGFEP